MNEHQSHSQSAGLPSTLEQHWGTTTLRALLYPSSQSTSSQSSSGDSDCDVMSQGACGGTHLTSVREWEPWGQHEGAEVIQHKAEQSTRAGQRELRLPDSLRPRQTVISFSICPCQVPFSPPQLCQAARHTGVWSHILQALTVTQHDQAQAVAAPTALAS